VGARRFADLGPLELELGGSLPAVRLAYETWGEIAADGGNAVLVLHALTGDAHVSGPAGPGQPTGGWWDGLIGPGRVLDTDRWYVVAANVLGGCQGSTGPASTAPDGRPWGSRFPRTTIGDQVRAELRLADHLGVRRWASVLGGSMGGMRALEWAVVAPERVGAALVLATSASASAEQIATQTTQSTAISSDAGWQGGDYYDAAAGSGPHRGLGLARRIAHLTYRSAEELEARFGSQPQDGEDPLLPGGRYAVQSYLDHHADKLSRRFDAGSYVVLTDAMTTWDVGRGRGGVQAALGGCPVPAVVAGVDSDRLYPIGQQQLIADCLPGGVGGLRTVRSPYGHDGFLLELTQVGELVREVLELGSAQASAGNADGSGVVGDGTKVRHDDVGVRVERPLADADDGAHAGSARRRDA
jgi:homoserine O-acetyltransferase